MSDSGVHCVNLFGYCTSVQSYHNEAGFRGPPKISSQVAKAVWTRKEFQPHYFQCWAMGIVANLSADAQRCTNGAKPTKLHIGKTLLRVGNESKGSFCKDQLNLILLLCRKGKQISRVYRLAHRTKKSIWSCH